MKRATGTAVFRTIMFIAGIIAMAFIAQQFGLPSPMSLDETYANAGQPLICTAPETASGISDAVAYDDDDGDDDGDDNDEPYERFTIVDEGQCGDNIHYVIYDDKSRKEEIPRCSEKEGIQRQSAIASGWHPQSLTMYTAALNQAMI